MQPPLAALSIYGKASVCLPAWRSCMAFLYASVAFADVTGAALAGAEGYAGDVTSNSWGADGALNITKLSSTPGWEHAGFWENPVALRTAAYRKSCSEPTVT